MNADPDRALLAASLAFAGAAVVGSAVAIHDELPGQPCGISVPLSVPAGLLAGWGAGIAAPWPMPVAAVIAAARSQRTGPSALTGAVCAGIGMGCVLGTAIEPVTCRPRSWSPATRLAIVFNMASSAALIVAGWRHQAAARTRPPRTG
jgi:drug/metabolite transporter (DMT)-like permease